jgi:hypothetical protein
MEVFIVRPFGKKLLPKRDKNSGKIIEEIVHDFDKVETDLIAPVLQELKIDGGTTGKIFESGDIREDMFSLLLRSDIVIADITVHNANVFYELGIRHALRDKKTILIKCTGFDDTPFDIFGTRYIPYDKDDPSAAVPALTKTLEETLLTDRKDSPVFNVLPQLVPQEAEKLVAVPADFTKEAEIAFRSNQPAMLSLLAAEAENFHWEIPALRIIGEMFFKMNEREKSRSLYEKIIMSYPDDIEANDRLATIYQRLSEKKMASDPDEGEALLVRSDLKIEKLLNTISDKDLVKKAEAFSLKGRNEKSRWLQQWRKLPVNEWAIGALKSKSLFEAYESYKQAYYEDLNHFYSGINALGLLTVIINLGSANSDVWELLYESKKEAVQKIKEFQEIHQNLVMCIKVSIEANKRKLEETDKKDPWLTITEADLYCLTGTNPSRVATMYIKALEGVSQLNKEATLRQLKIYEQLKIVAENVKAALAIFPEAQLAPKLEQTHYLLFTGHMIDKSDRREPRFPAKKEDAVRQKIKNEIERVRDKTGGKLSCVAGGACGGDIIFHELARELGIASTLYLALPREQFLVESVEFAGNEWVDRFDALYKNMPFHVLSQIKELPRWLQKKKGYTIWERNNLWELNCALVNGGINMTLIALWDGKAGDGPGGTADMIRIAKLRGANTIVIDIMSL